VYCKQYVKKAIPILAFKYDGDLFLSNGEENAPYWAIEAYNEGILYYDDPPWELYIKTLEGDMHCSIDDYIIRGIHGELYPCKADIFEESYVEV
jgi:hypothetical protein